MAKESNKAKISEHLVQSVFQQKNAFSILIIFTALSLVGLAFIPKLKLQLNPTVAVRDISVSCIWHGATPQAVEREVVTPLESILNTIPHIVEIYSVSDQGRCRITLSFDKHTNLDQARFEVASVIRQVYSKLPRGVSYPQIGMQNPDEQEIRSPVLVYTLNGPVDSHTLTTYAEDQLKTRFSDVEGLRSIGVSGGTKTAWFVNYDRDELNLLGLDAGQIRKALNQYFNRYDLGLVTEKRIESNNQLAVFVNNQKKVGIVDWDEVIVGTVGDRIVRLTDICTIRHDELPAENYYRINGLNSIYMRFYPEKGTNHMVLANAVKTIMDVQKEKLPEKYAVLLSRDSTVFIQKELEIIGYRSLMTVVILLVFVLLISLSLRYMIILTLSLFSNIALSFMFYYLLGINIHLYSLAGITISLGLIIDNSIVMIDHIRIYSNKRVYVALLASTLTTIASLSIVLFLPESLQLNLRDFAFIIMVNLAVSLLISLWYIPALLQQYPIRNRAKRALIRRRKRIIKLNRFYSLLGRVFIRWRWVFIIGGVLLFGLPIFWLPEKVEGEQWYHQVYNKTVGADWYQNDAKKWTEKTLGGTLRLFVQNVYEGNYYREKQETKLYVRAGLPEGATIEQLNEIMVRMEQYLASFDEVRQFTTEIYNPQSGNITIFFKPEFEKSAFPYLLKGKLTQKAIDFGGINWNIYGVGQGYYNRTGTEESLNYNIQLSGYNYDELERQAQKLKGKLSQHPRVAKINTNAKVSWYEKDYVYRYSLSADPYLLASYDKPYRELAEDLSMLGINYRPAMYQLINERYEGIVLQSEESRSFDQWSVFHQTLNTEKNYTLAHLAEINKERMSPAIHKSNQQYIRKVAYKYNGNYKFGNRFRKIVLEEMNHEMPLGYHAKSQQWNYWDRNKAKPYHLILIIVLAVFIISAVLFESLRQPLAIVMLIPLSFVGVFLTFYWFDLNFDQGGYASFILLSGLVVNSAIYIINDFNNKMREVKMHNIRMSPLRVYMKAFNGKIIPVFLTIISSILGLVPFMTLGKEEPFWYAFAAGAIGGLVFSGIIMLVYLPLFLIRRKMMEHR